MVAPAAPFLAGIQLRRDGDRAIPRLCDHAERRCVRGSGWRGSRCRPAYRVPAQHRHCVLRRRRADRPAGRADPGLAPAHRSGRAGADSITRNIDPAGPALPLGGARRDRDLSLRGQRGDDRQPAHQLPASGRHPEREHRTRRQARVVLLDGCDGGPLPRERAAAEGSGATTTHALHAGRGGAVSDGHAE